MGGPSQGLGEFDAPSKVVHVHLPQALRGQRNLLRPAGARRFLIDFMLAACGEFATALLPGLMLWWHTFQDQIEKRGSCVEVAEGRRGRRKTLMSGKQEMRKP